MNTNSATVVDIAVLPEAWDHRAARVVSLCFVVNMLDGMNVLVMSYIAPELTRNWSMAASQISIVFSAGLVGMALGGFLGGPVGDRVGRRTAIVGALTLMAVGMFGSSFSRGIFTLCTCRLVVGLGIGTVLPAMAALAGEVAPPQYRNYAVGIVQAGYPLAAVGTGFAAAAILPVYGWRKLLLGASALTVLLVPLALAIMPRATRPKPDAAKRLPFRALVSGELRRPTLLLWTAIFSGFMVLYFVVSWIPTLSIAAGLSEANAIYAGALYNLGAFVGTVGMSILAIGHPLRRVVPILLVPAACAMLIFGSVPMGLALALLTAFIIGATLQGGFNGIYPLCASLYPAQLRATGIGWAMGIGRAGAVFGPLLGGYLISAKASLSILFGTFTIPLLLCSLAVSQVGRGVRQGVQ
ncbi:MAG: major facilitator superfamily 1 [Alphaproteobacteria bacterium]|nr:major facilitator superfamily 1 [Alphaproteobacteria bacterium]